MAEVTETTMRSGKPTSPVCDCRRSAPRAHWHFVWGTGLALTVLVFCFLEGFWRSQGHRPSVVDSQALWAIHRAEVSDNRPSHVVLLGASRIQLGLSTETFRQRYPHYRLTQLAVDGSSPVASLASLAEDPSFRGTVICSLTAQWVWPQLVSGQDAYAEYYRRQHSPARSLETAMKCRLQERLVAINPHVRVARVLYHLVSRRALPAPSYLTTHSDRSRLADYSLSDLSKYQHQGATGSRHGDGCDIPSPAEWITAFERVEGYVRQIEARGGQVVFVRFPTTDETWAEDELHFPRAEYWDRMAAVTTAETLHFLDVPALTQFDLPDTSHLDAKDAPLFTSILLDCLQSRGILSSRIPGHTSPGLNSHAVQLTDSEQSADNCPASPARQAQGNSLRGSRL